MADDAKPASLAEMTVEIVCAYVSRNQVAASDLPKVISTVAGELRILGREPQAAAPSKLTPNQYRETFRLKPDYPMAAPNYAQQRRELAAKIGLGRPKKATRRRRRKAAGAQVAPGIQP
jgi:predicted transcriptional regulator